MSAAELAGQTAEPAMAAVAVRDLQVEIEATGTPVISDVAFTIARGEILGVVGESGSGKTTVGLALLGHARRGLRIAGGSVLLGDRDVLTLDEEQLRRLRGTLVSYVPQDPASSLNPALRIGTQLREVIEAHGTHRDSAVSERVAEMMREVTVRELATLHDVAALYVSHDLAVVATLAEWVAVMYAGRVVEIGGAEELFRSAGHPYTRRLVGAIPRLTGGRSLVGIPGHAVSPGRRPPGCSFAPRCTLRIDECEAAVPPLLPVGPGHAVRCIRAELVISEAQSRAGDPIEMPAADEAEMPALRLENVIASYGRVEVLHSVSLSLASHECLAVVGESGSGKTTVARAIAGLHRNWTGTIALGGAELQRAARQRSNEARRRIAYIFQNPYGSLNPRHTVGQLIEQPLKIFGTASGREADRRIAEMLEQVSLTAAYASRYPDQLSGGERQRVAIARALVCDPTVLICDEVTSALDVSVQAAIVELLGNLQRDLGLAMLFITHNLPLVRSVAQRVAVLSQGSIVEHGDVKQVLTHPGQPYTRQLLSDTPSLETATSEVGIGEPPAGAAGS